MPPQICPASARAFAAQKSSNGEGVYRSSRVIQEAQAMGEAAAIAAEKRASTAGLRANGRFAGEDSCTNSKTDSTTPANMKKRYEGIRRAICRRRLLCLY
jgi:hypothetical protein